MRKIWIVLVALTASAITATAANSLELQQQPLAALGYTYYGIKADGTLLAWGDSFHGATGREDDLTFSQATSILSGSQFVSGNMNLGLAIDQKKTLWGWGWDWTGRLKGNEAAEKAPVKLLEQVVAVDAGLHHCIALLDDGSVWAWGSNQYGQLGVAPEENSGTQMIAYPPRQVLEQVCAINTDRMFANVAVKEDDTVWVWGQLGEDGSVRYDTPQQILDHAQKAHWEYGGNGSTYLMVLGNDGDLWKATFGGAQKTDITLKLFLENVVTITNGCAITSDQTLWTWGAYQPDCAASQNEDRPAYTMSDVVYAVSDIGCTLVIKADGTLWELRTNGSARSDASDTVAKAKAIQLDADMLIPVQRTNATPNREGPSLTVQRPESGSELSDDARAAPNGYGNGLIAGAIGFGVMVAAIVIQKRKK